jgi:hypothetical protein
MAGLYLALEPVLADDGQREDVGLRAAACASPHFSVAATTYGLSALRAPTAITLAKAGLCVKAQSACQSGLANKHHRAIRNLKNYSLCVWCPPTK